MWEIYCPKINKPAVGALSVGPLTPIQGHWMLAEPYTLTLKHAPTWIFIYVKKKKKIPIPPGFQ